MKAADIKSMHCVLLHDAQSPLPPGACRSKFYISESTGKRLFMHVLSLHDYAHVCNALNTPAEVIEYLEFREDYLLTILDAKDQSEKSLLGRYFMGDAPGSLRLDVHRDDFSEAVDNLKDARVDWDCRRLFHEMVEHRYPIDRSISGTARDNELILQLALLKRNELGLLCERIRLAIEKAKGGQPARPNIAISPERGCAYVAAAVLPEQFENRFKYLREMLEIAKYEHRLTKAVGVAAAIYDDQVYLDWMYCEGSPLTDDEPTVQELHRIGSPFGKLKTASVERFTTRIDED